MDLIEDLVLNDWLRKGNVNSLNFNYYTSLVTFWFNTTYRDVGIQKQNVRHKPRLCKHHSWIFQSFQLDYGDVWGMEPPQSHTIPPPLLAYYSQQSKIKTTKSYQTCINLLKLFLITSQGFLTQNTTNKFTTTILHLKNLNTQQEHYKYKP